MRDFLRELDELGELRKVSGATWEEEIGGITELMTERRGKGLLFDDIPGYPKGYRVASNLFTTARRTAAALGLDPSPEGLHERWKAMMRDLRPIPPQEVSTGPVFENVDTGDAVDLFKFPTPRWHEQDGGRYIGTGVCVIQQEPSSGFVNVGAYRVAIHDQRTCTIFIEHGKHGDMIRRQYWDRGEKCPIVVSCGQDGTLTALAGPSVFQTPAGVSELDVAGYVRQTSYPIVRGQVTGLPIPAHSEIAIEGFMPPSDQIMVPEGPFGEWTGYYAHGRSPETIIEVSAVYYRNDPIIFGLPPMRPVGCYYNPNLGDEDLDSRLKVERAGLPGVKRVNILARPNLRVVAIEQQYAGHVEDVVRVLVPEGDQYMGHLIWILVDDDIDVTSEQEVLWAIASRCAPETGVCTFPSTGVWQLDPRLRPEDRSEPGKESGRKRYTAHNLVINACRPYDWIDQFPPVAMNSPELRQRIRERWKDLFAPAR
jgi:4-hydroxy-3-polyprenylbenzoate decarboxylase